MYTLKTIFCLFLIGLVTTTLQAQVGIGTTEPKGALDISSSTDGLLIPRVALTDLTTVTVTTPIASELVYNTTSNGSVSPGFYYLFTAAGPWVRFGGSGWLVDGNVGTSATVNFVGTIDNVDLSFRRNNLGAGRLTGTSTSFGVGALISSLASENAAFGNNALRNTTGTQNTALGHSALTANISGSGNVAIGFQSLQANTNSLRNTAIGWRSMANINTPGATENVAIGWQAMQDTPSGSGVNFSVFIGAQAGRNFRGNNGVGIGRQALGGNNGGNNNIGIDNTAIGYQALSFNTTGQQNTAVGAESMYRVSTGRENSALGFRSGGALTSGIQNTFLGHFSGTGVTTGSNNITIGYQAQVPLGSATGQMSIGNIIYGINGATGNIGIGTNNPTTKLEVAGKIKAVDVNFSGLPVFADNAAAASLTNGDLYQTPTGEIRIKI